MIVPEVKVHLLAGGGSRRIWYCVDLPQTDYRQTRDLQGRLVAARRDRVIGRDIVLLLEHPPVFTLGRRGGMDNMTVSPGLLQNRGVPVIQAERGGGITFHGPGQLVVYPIIDMPGAKLRVVDYVNRLEEVMILVAAEWGIMAKRDSMSRGVWVGPAKLGSIGIAVRRGICFHGLALNVNTLMDPFAWISPCGLKGVEMTSMEMELSCKVPMDRVREAVRLHLEAVFGVKLAVTSMFELQEMLS